MDGGFEGAAAIEAGGAGVGVDAGFGFGGGFVEFGPFGFEEVEVGEAGCHEGGDREVGVCRSVSLFPG